MNERESSPLRHFASDNNAGVCPEAWEALRAADAGHAPGYGDDPLTARARDLFQQLFETDCEVHFVFNGTAANSLVTAAACEPFHAVICHAWSHLETDESNAPGFFAHGVKTLPVDTPLGKLTPEAVRRVHCNRRDIHASAPQLLSLTQATELGTVYSTAETRALGDCARELGLLVHMDGARFANAAATLGAAPADLTWRSGVDALCFGGTKNGMLTSEAVVLFHPDLKDRFVRRCKQSGQLASKMRYHAAQWIGMIESGAWLRHAAHANRMAGLLEDRLRPLPGVEILHPRQANAVFAALPALTTDRLRHCGWRFYSDVGPGGARLMCSWDTREDDIERLLQDALGIAPTSTERGKTSAP